jgi:hypothetical protein
MHAYLSEVMARMRIEEHLREAAAYRLARQARRGRVRRAVRPAPPAMETIRARPSRNSHGSSPETSQGSTQSPVAQGQRTSLTSNQGHSTDRESVGFGGPDR